jgi:hypothetical protein
VGPTAKELAHATCGTSSTTATNKMMRLISATSFGKGATLQPRLKLTNVVTLASSDESSMNAQGIQGFSSPLLAANF